MFEIGLGHFEYTARINGRLRTVLDTNRITYGPLCEELEERWASLHKAKYGLIAASGTDALLATLMAYKIHHGWPDDGEVLVPATTFVATINAVLLCGLKPVLVDINPDWLMNVADAESKRTAKTVAVIPVHLFGKRLRFDGYFNGLTVIEDACESALVTPLSGDASCFSFYGAHHYVGGVGGCIITNDIGIGDTIRSVLNHGRDTAYTSVDSPKTEQVRLKRFTFHHVGLSSRMTELQAALVLGQLDEPNYVDVVSMRQRVSLSYSPYIDRKQFLAPHTWQDHSFMMYPLLLKQHDPDKKDRICALFERNGIETRDAMPIVTQPVYKDMIERPEDYPRAYHAAMNGFAIPCHQAMSVSDVAKVCNVLKQMGEA